MKCYLVIFLTVVVSFLKYAPAILVTSIRQQIHKLNRVLYNHLCAVKNLQFSRLVNDVIGVKNVIHEVAIDVNHEVAINVSVYHHTFNHNNNVSNKSFSHHNTVPNSDKKAVVTIPHDLPLSKAEISVLSKGLNFIPVSKKSDEFQVKKD